MVPMTMDDDRRYVKSELYEKAIHFFERASQIQPDEVGRVGRVGRVDRFGRWVGL